MSPHYKDESNEQGLNSSRTSTCSIPPKFLQVVMMDPTLGTEEAFKRQIAPSTLWRYHEKKIERFGRLSNVPVDTNPDEQRRTQATPVWDKDAYLQVFLNTGEQLRTPHAAFAGQRSRVRVSAGPL